MAEGWYLARQGQRQGPYSPAQVRAMLTGGQLQPGDMLLPEGTTKWLTLDQARNQLQPPPSAAPEQPARREGYGAELCAVCQVLWQQALRLWDYSGVWWELRERQNKASAAQLIFGEKLYALGIGDPEIRSRVTLVAQDLQKLQGEKKSTTALEKQRRHLLLQLAEPLIPQVAPIRGAEVEHHRAFETWLELQKLEKTANEARKNLWPTDRPTRRRLLVGCSVLATLFLLLVVLVVFWTLPCPSIQVADAGGKDQLRLTRQPLDWSKVDYSIPKVDYSHGPEGQPIEKQAVQEGTSEKVISEGYRTAGGKFVLHGKTTVLFPLSDRPRSESWHYQGQPHGLSVEWFGDGVKVSEGTFKRGEKHGKWQAFHPSGTLREQEFWWEGVLHGPRQQWYANGQLRSEETWVEGLRQGNHRTWTEDGRLVLEVSFLEDLPQFRPREVTRDQFRLLVALTSNHPPQGFAGRGRLNLPDGLSYFFKVFGKPAHGWQEVADWSKLTRQSWRFSCRDGQITLEVELVNPRERVVIIRQMTDG